MVYFYIFVANLEALFLWRQLQIVSLAIEAGISITFRPSGAENAHGPLSPEELGPLSYCQCNNYLNAK